MRALEDRRSVKEREGREEGEGRREDVRKMGAERADGI